MQFTVPQFVDIEDTIIGSITLKQFIFLIVVGVIVFFLWYLFKLWFVIVIGIPLIALALAFVFVKINGRSLPAITLAWINYWLKPRFYVWKKEK